MKWIACALVLIAAACGGKVPATRYYQLAAPAAEAGARGDLTLVLEPLTTEAGYDDERIVYRTTPFRMDYYQYHRWSAAPGVMIGNYLEQALERGGRFRAVVREQTDQTQVVLGGRVVAIEEIDTSKTSWTGRLVLELTLSDPKTGAMLWTEQFEEREPLAEQTPEGLAQALSRALGRIADKAGPAIADLAQGRSATASRAP